MLGEPRLSRRDFLRLAGLGLGAVAFSSVSEYAERMEAETEKTGVVSKEWNDQLYRFNISTEMAINELYCSKGIYVCNLKKWNGNENLAWPEDAITEMIKSIDLLPDSYLCDGNKPKFIFLVRSIGTTQDSVGGGYAKGSISLYISESFDIWKPRLCGVQGEIYGSALSHMRANIAHEFTHIYEERQEDIFNRFVEYAKWKMIDGKWVNNDPDTLMVEARAELDPYEDLAVTVARWSANSESVSESRRWFMQEVEPYKSWRPIRDMVR